MDTTRGNAGKAQSYEAQMIMCILIIYPLAVSVHVMNEMFSSSLGII